MRFFRKLIKYFVYFRMKFALFFRFFDDWYIIDSLGSTEHTVSLGLSQQVLIMHIMLMYLAVNILSYNVNI